MKTGYQCGPAAVDVETDDASSGLWLEEFLCPWAEAIEHGNGQASVHLARSSSRFDTLQRLHGVKSSRPVPAFALDSRTVALSGCEDEDAMLLADAVFGCYYRVAEQRVEVAARPGHRRSRLGLMRVVREMLAARVFEQGGILDLHAAGFATEGRAVVIAGPKGTGKTTLLVHALVSTGAEFVANDRVFVDVGSRQTTVVGIPTLISIRPWTLEAFPSLRERAGQRPASLLASEAAAPGGVSPEGVSAATDLVLAPSQLAGNTGVRRARGATLAAVLFPLVSATSERYRIDALSRADAARMLSRSIYGARGEGRVRTIFHGAVRETALPDQEEIAEQLASTVPCYRCTLGPAAYSGNTNGWLHGLLGQI